MNIQEQPRRVIFVGMHNKPDTPPLSSLTMWKPDGRSKRATYIVRLHFNQIPGKGDVTKDKHFDTQEAAEKYVYDEFKKHIDCIGYELGLWKGKTTRRPIKLN